MAISMVRKPSETPNINNISDIIPFRYAYGGQNGYVKGKGRELDYTALGTQFTIGSGRVVLDGVESDIDSDGVIINIDSVSETRYYVVYYNVNLATNTTTIMSEYATGSYPTIEKGDDLTESPEGSANLVLYKFIATSGIISNVEKVVKEITYPLVNYDASKGTVEERLAKLGFKGGAIENLVATAPLNRLRRQGNYVIGELAYGVIKLPTDNVWGSVPPEFTPLFNNASITIPIKAVRSYYESSGSQMQQMCGGVIILAITEDGQVKIDNVEGVHTWRRYYPSSGKYEGGFEELTLSILRGFSEIIGGEVSRFGYEAKPL